MSPNTRLISNGMSFTLAEICIPRLTYLILPCAGLVMLRCAILIYAVRCPSPSQYETAA